MIEKTFPSSFPTTTLPSQPGIEEDMQLKPICQLKEYDVFGNRLKDKVAIITGGDSGIGRAVALSFVKEGCKVVIVYLNEDKDAKKTEALIKELNGQCILMKGDIGVESFSNTIVKNTMESFGQIDIIVTNAGEQHTINSLCELTSTQLERTFKTNVFGAIYLIKAAESYLKEGASIIITTSVTAYHGHEKLIDYSSSKGALSSLTRSLALMYGKKGIRVNAVAPGPIWTPLIPSSFTPQELSEFGSKTVFKRAGQPVEVAEAYVFLASQGASFITGETIHVNGGEIINS